MVHKAFAHYGNRFKTAVRMPWKAGNLLAVVHSPAVFHDKILPDAPAGKQRWVGPHRVISLGKFIFMMHAKEKRVSGFPLKSQWFHACDGISSFSLHIVFICPRPMR